MWQVVGYSGTVSLLERSLVTGRLAHAYLFVGPKHVGKRTMAVKLAQALNCEGMGSPCGECRQCRRIAGGKHADVQVIGLEQWEGLGEGSAKKEIGIDRIRELQRAAHLRPYEGKHRVFIIDGAEHMSREASNCLLKTLEEPPPNVLLILLTEDERLLLPTIRSRCQRIELRPLTAETVARALESHWSVERKQAELVAHLSQGCFGLALTMLAGEESLAQRREKLDRLVGLSRASLEERFTYAGELASGFSRDREGVGEVLELWLGWWRDILLAKEGAENYITNIDRMSEIQGCAQSYTSEEIKGFIYALGEVMEQMEQNINPRLALEVLMLSLPKAGEPCPK